jgi:hypothetical protein
MNALFGYAGLDGWCVRSLLISHLNFDSVILFGLLICDLASLLVEKARG